MEDRLKKFARLVDAGTYTAAAKLLHTSQPSLSTAIKKLERELKGSLIRPGGKAMELTKLGQIAYDVGVELLDIRSNLMQRVREVAGEPEPIRLGLIDSIADISATSGQLAKLESAVALSCYVQNSKTLLSQLRRGELDFVICTKQEMTPGPITSLNLGAEQFSLVGSTELISKLDSPTTSSQPWPLLAYNKSSTTYRLIKQQLDQSQLRFEVNFSSSYPSILIELARQGRGLAALPSRLVQGSRLVIRQTPEPLARPISAYWSSKRSLPAACSDFLIQIKHLLGQ